MFSSDGGQKRHAMKTFIRPGRRLRSGICLYDDERLQFVLRASGPTVEQFAREGCACGNAACCSPSQPGTSGCRTCPANPENEVCSDLCVSHRFGDSLLTAAMENRVALRSRKQQGAALRVNPLSLPVVSGNLRLRDFPQLLLTDRIHPDTRLHECDGAYARDLHVLVGVVLVLAHELHVACAV